MCGQVGQAELVQRRRRGQPSEPEEPRSEEPPAQLCSLSPSPVQVLGTEEDVSVYDMADHPDFHFRTSDIVIRIWNSEHGQKDCENGVRTAAGGWR